VIPDTRGLPHFDVRWKTTIRSDRDFAKVFDAPIAGVITANSVATCRCSGGEGSIGIALTQAAIPPWIRLSLLEECALGILGAGTLVPGEGMRLLAALGGPTLLTSELGAAFTRY
jgi:hypothetical protein